MQFRMQFKSKTSEEEAKDLNQNYENLSYKFCVFFLCLSFWHFAILQKEDATNAQNDL